MNYFSIPLNLPHAATVAGRIRHLLYQRVEAGDAPALPLAERSDLLYSLLIPYVGLDDNGPEEEAEETRQDAAALLRELVAEMERSNRGGDRLGQCVRNLFECLEMGEEGAAAGLRAGENPHSLQRPA